MTLRGQFSMARDRACPVAQAPAVAVPFSAALGELKNEVLGSREGEPTHAIVEVHPIRAEAVVVS